MARVELTEDARAYIRHLDGSAKKLVAKALKKLEVDPGQRGAPLGGGLVTFRKLVVGDRDYRIVYRVEPDDTVVVVWVVARRADAECYQLAMSRLSTLGDREVADDFGRVMREVWNATDTERRT